MSWLLVAPILVPIRDRDRRAAGRADGGDAADDLPSPPPPGRGRPARRLRRADERGPWTGAPPPPPPPPPPLLAGQMGDWPAPFGITLVADHLVGGDGGDHRGSPAWRSWSTPSPTSTGGGSGTGFQAMLANSCWPACAAPSSTGDLFNLYVWFGGQC